MLSKSISVYGTLAFAALGISGCSSSSSSGSGSSDPNNVTNECVQRDVVNDSLVSITNTCDFTINIGRIVEGNLAATSSLAAGATISEFSGFDVVACQAPATPTSIDSCSQ